VFFSITLNLSEADSASKPAVEASKDLTLKAIYSRSLHSATSLATDDSKVDLYSDDSGSGKSYADLLARSDVQAVIIAYYNPSQHF